MEKKEVKISLWAFYVLVAAIVILIGAVAIGWMKVAENKGANVPPPVAQSVKTNVIEQTSKNGEEQKINQTENSNAQKQDLQNNQSIPTNGTELDINSELVSKLYEEYLDIYKNEDGTWSISNFDTFDHKNYLSNYRSKKTTNTNLENNIKLLAVLKSLLKDKNYTIIPNNTLKMSNVDGYESRTIELRDFYIWDVIDEKVVYKDIDTYQVNNDVCVFSIENIQKKSDELYNTNVNIEKKSFDMLAEGFYYDNGTYKYFGFDGGGDYGFFDRVKILKAEKNDDEIYIYDNYIRIKEAYDEQIEETEFGYTGPVYYMTGYNVYATSDENYKIYNFDVNDTEIYDTIANLRKKGVTLPIYKHTFKQKNDGTYYWLSSELINKNELKVIE